MSETLEAPWNMETTDEWLTGDDAAKLIIEAEETIEAIKNGEIEGEYFEF